MARRLGKRQLLTRAQERIGRSIQDTTTISIMLDRGAVITRDGPLATLQVPGEQVTATFPFAVVEHVINKLRHAPHA